MARILLGVSGGIAAYKALELARLATVRGHSLRVAMTPAALRFVGAASFEGIVGAPVLRDEFERDPMRGAYPDDPGWADAGTEAGSGSRHDPIAHLAVAQRAEAMLVAPASANTLAKLAAGFADSMLTTSFLACPAPRAVAPAMNDRMYRDEATQANLRTLAERGVRVIEPGEGPLASRGEHGVGRLPDPDRLLFELESMLEVHAGRWDGLRVLVSAGGTREPVDAVRYLGNRSSGRMGLALAGAAARRGAAVTLVAANVSLPAPPGVRRVDVETAAELAAALEAEIERADVLLMAAAVADFRAPDASGGKLARDGRDGLSLRLEPTEDVLAGLAARRRPDQVLVGFAAEHGAGGLERARQKLARKRVDAIVLNDVSQPGIGFESEENAVTIVERDDETVVARAPKSAVADAILERVAFLRARVEAR